MVPNDLKGTRVHAWNAAFQRQLGSSFAVSATYLGNYMNHIWGDVTGNPGRLPAGAAATGPCTLNSPTGPQTFANCSTAPLDLRRDITQANPAIGQYIGFLDWITDAGWQRYNGLLLSLQKRAGNGLSYTANYTVSKCEGIAQSNTGGNTWVITIDASYLPSGRTADDFFAAGDAVKVVKWNAATATTVVSSVGDATDLGFFATGRLWFTDAVSAIGGVRVDSYRANFRSTTVGGVATAAKVLRPSCRRPSRRSSRSTFPKPSRWPTWLTRCR